MSTTKDFIIIIVGSTQTGNHLLEKIKSLLNPTTNLLLAINYSLLCSVAKNKTLAEHLRFIKIYCILELATKSVKTRASS